MFTLRIKEARIMKGMSQTELAHKAGISQSYLSSLERFDEKTKSPSLTVIESLAKALEVCPHALFYISCNTCTGTGYFKDREKCKRFYLTKLKERIEQEGY